jgi:hypothetical protein
MRGAPIIQFQSDDRPEIRLQKLRRLAEAVAAIDLTPASTPTTASDSSITMTGPAALGRLSGTGEPIALTGAQLTTILATFSAANKGVVPAPGTSTGNRFLRDDGGWTGITIAPGSLLHADLGGLLADDHTQYVLRDILTTDGDLFTRTGGIVDRIALGTEAQVLRSISGAASWQTVSPVLTLGTDLSGNATFTDLGNATLNATIVNDAVTNAKLRDGAALSVIGRSANTSGDPADIAGTADQVLRVNSAGTVLGFGTVATAGLTDDAVTNAKIRNSAAFSVIGRSAATTGDPDDIAGTTDQVLRVNSAGTALGFGTIATGGLTANAVTNAKLAQMTQATIKGRAAAAGTGDPTDLTAAEVATIVNSSLDHGTLTGLGDDDHTQYVLRNILTTNGDLFTRTAGAVARLGIGTSLQLLRTVAGAPTWVTLSPTVTLGTDLSGNVTLTDLASGTLGATIVNDAVTDAKLRNAAALSVIGRSANSSGDPADITGSTDQVLRVDTGGTTLGFGTVATGGLAANAVTNAKLAQMTQATVKGRADAAGTGDPTDLTAAQVAAIVGASGSLTISGATPFLGFAETDQASTDEQIWAHFINGKTYKLLTYTAGFATSRQQLGFTRGTGAAVTTIDIGNTSDNAAVNFLGTGAVAIGGALSVTGAVTVPNTSFTYAKLQNVSATSRVLGRITAGAGVIEELTAANLATIVNASLDHGTLTGLSDDDHPQYAAVAQTEAIVSAWNFTARQQVFGTTTANIALVSGLADSGTSIHCVENLKFHRIAAEPFMILNRINGSYAAPTALLNGDSCGGFLWGGYQGAAMAAQSGFLEYSASEDWSSTAQGGNMRFQTTIAGTTTRQLRLLLGADATGAFARLPSGVAAQPGWAFLSDTDTGRYLVGANSIGEATGGVLRLTLDTTALTLTLPFRGPNGTAAAPTFSWSGDTNNGAYYIGTDNWGLSANSLLQFELGATYSDMKTQARFTGRQDPAQFTANQNDFAVTTTVSRIYADSDASRDFTGMTGGADGRVIFFFNDGATNAIVIKHESASSTAANRFSLPSATDTTIQPGGGAGFQYDGTTSRWRQFTRVA